MIGANDPITFSVAQLGSLNRAEAHVAIGIANQIQAAFHFEFLSRCVHLNLKRYRLPNSGYDLDGAVQQLLKQSRLPRPLILLTSLPYGDRANGRRADHFYFADYELEFDRQVSIVSTYLWEHLPGDRHLQPYILCNLATLVLSLYARLEVHANTQSKHRCLFEYCDEPSSIDGVFEGTGLCRDDANIVHAKVKNSALSVPQVASAFRLFNRAANKRTCFVVMPFRVGFRKVYEAIAEVMTTEGWSVMRADEMMYPSRITDTIIQGIWTADFVVADMTGGNPNVFYEIGIAHTLGRDTILITQDAKDIIDVNNERKIRYRPDKPGLDKLKRKLRKLCE